MTLRFAINLPTITTKNKSILPNFRTMKTLVLIIVFSFLLRFGYCQSKIPKDFNWKWTPQNEASFLKAIQNEQHLKTITQPTRTKICKCIIVKLKKLYPDGVPTLIPKEVVEMVSDTCTNDKIFPFPQ